jgi:integrase/recombinase XerD
MLSDVCPSMVRDILHIGSNALERQVVTLWLKAGYRPSTIERRIRDKWRIYRRLGNDQPESRIARRLTCPNVARAARAEARSRSGDRKLNARIMKASLRAWAEALSALGKSVPAWMPRTPREATRTVLDDYWSYTQRIRNLAKHTFPTHRLYLAWFLDDLRQRKIAVRAITLTDVDHFVSTLTTHRKLTLTSTANACICVRHFVRFLYRTGRIRDDISPAVIGPTLRQMPKRPPARMAWPVLKKILSAIDRTRPLGKRDFAIFITAASYGWGAADVLSLRLDDIDWYQNTLSVVRPKTGVRIEVPLRPHVAHALATYIQTARPRNTGRREVFLRHYAPWAKVPKTNTIGKNLRRYAAKAGVVLPVQYSTKIFRCIHISEQLNGGVPSKVVAEVVGHSDTRSISRYAGIDIKRMRICALPVPR